MSRKRKSIRCGIFSAEPSKKRNAMKSTFAAVAAIASFIALGACQRALDKPAAPTNADEKPRVPSAANDTCNAKSHSWLIGQDHKRVPPAPAGKVVRVVCSTCAMTMDFNQARLNVFFDEKTGVVTRLTCG